MNLFWIVDVLLLSIPSFIPFIRVSLSFPPLRLHIAPPLTHTLTQSLTRAILLSLDMFFLVQSVSLFSRTFDSSHSVNQTVSQPIKQ